MITNAHVLDVITCSVCALPVLYLLIASPRRYNTGSLGVTLCLLGNLCGWLLFGGLAVMGLFDIPVMGYKNPAQGIMSYSLARVVFAISTQTVFVMQMTKIAKHRTHDANTNELYQQSKHD